MCRLGIIQEATKEQVTGTVLRLGKTGRVPYVLSTGIPSEISAYLKLDYGIVDDDCYDAAKKKVMSNLRTLPGSQLMGGKYVAPFTSRVYLHGRGLTGCSEDTTVSQYVSRFPDMCQWLPRLAESESERVGDMCRRYNYTANCAWFSCTCCLLDDSRVAKLLPGEGDLGQFLQSRLPALRVALRAYQRFHGHSPSPYVLLQEVFGQEMVALGQERAERLAPWSPVPGTSWASLGLIRP
jgi:hypothetical protein